MRKISLLLVFFMLFSCNPEKNKADNGVSQANLKYTGYFKNYLQKQFQKEIPKEKHYFVLIPSKGCPSCKKQEVRDFLKILDKPAFTLIVAESIVGSMQIPSGFKGNKLLIDEDDFIDKQNLPFREFTGIYKTEDGAISDIIPFNFENYKEIFRVLD